MGKCEYGMLCVCGKVFVCIDVCVCVCYVCSIMRGKVYAVCVLTFHVHIV